MATLHDPTVTYRRSNSALTCGNARISVMDVIAECDDAQARLEASGLDSVQALGLLAQIAHIGHAESRDSGDVLAAAEQLLACAIYIDRWHRALDDARADQPVTLVPVDGVS